GDGIVKLRDAAVPTAKWPRPGDVLPVEVDPHTRHVRIRWDKADGGQARASDHFDVVEDDIEYAPTPPGPTSPSPASPGPAAYPAPMRAIEAGPNAVTA